jgi:hypothetical protein
MQLLRILIGRSRHQRMLDSRDRNIRRADSIRYGMQVHGATRSLSAKPARRRGLAFPLIAPTFRRSASICLIDLAMRASPHAKRILAIFATVASVDRSRPRALVDAKVSMDTIVQSSRAGVFGEIAAVWSHFLIGNSP